MSPGIDFGPLAEAHVSLHVDSRVRAKAHPNLHVDSGARAKAYVSPVDSEQSPQALPPLLSRAVQMAQGKPRHPLASGWPRYGFRDDV